MISTLKFIIRLLYDLKQSGETRSLMVLPVKILDSAFKQRVLVLSVADVYNMVFFCMFFIEKIYNILDTIPIDFLES